MKKLSIIFTSLLFTLALIGCEDSSQVEKSYTDQPIVQESYEQERRIEQQQMQNAIVQQQIIQQLSYGYRDYNQSDVEYYYKTCLFTEGLDQDDYCEDICGYEYDANSCDDAEDDFTAIYGKFGSDKSRGFKNDYNGYSNKYRTTTTTTIHVYEHKNLSKAKQESETRKANYEASKAVSNKTKQTAPQSNLSKKKINTNVKTETKAITTPKKNTAPQSNLSRKKTETKIATATSLTVKKQAAVQSNLKRKPKKEVAVTVVSTSSYKKSGSPYSCGSYSPSTSSKKKGKSFKQKATCTQKLVQTIKYSNGTSKTKSKTKRVTKSRSAKGTK